MKAQSISGKLKLNRNDCGVTANTGNQGAIARYCTKAVNKIFPQVLGIKLGANYRKDEKSTLNGNLDFPV